MAYNVGLVGPYDYDGVIANDFFAAMTLFYADRAHLVTRLPNVPIEAVTVKAVDDAYRPKSTTVNVANGLNNSSTTLTLADASFLMVGDVVQVDDELFLITTAHATAPTVTRGHASTTAAAHNN